MSWVQTEAGLSASALAALLPTLVENNVLAEWSNVFSTSVVVRNVADNSWMVFEYVADSSDLGKRDLPRTLRIKNKSSGLFIGIGNAATNKGAHALQWNIANDGSQGWVLEKPRADIPFFNIKNQHSGLYLGVGQASENNGADIIQWSKVDDGSQEWLILAAEQGQHMKVLNPHSRKVWGIANSSHRPGENLIQWTPINVDDQLWQFDLL